jgi:hypothetical protein
MCWRIVKKSRTVGTLLLYNEKEAHLDGDVPLLGHCLQCPAVVPAMATKDCAVFSNVSHERRGKGSYSPDQLS